MSKRPRVVISLACALLAVAICAAYVGSVREEAARASTEAMRRYGGEVVSLVVATRTIEAGEVVSMVDVETREWLSSLAPEGAQTSVDEVVGREVSVPACAGAPLTSLNFRDPGEMAEIPAGHVAVSIPITEKLGVTYGIAVGTHVVTYRATEGSAELIGGDATVLAVPGTGNSMGRGSLTIAVTAKDVPTVLAASASGDLRLVVPADDVRELATGAEATKTSVPPAQKNREEGSAQDSGESASKGSNEDTVEGKDE